MKPTIILANLLIAFSAIAQAPTPASDSFDGFWLEQAFRSYNESFAETLVGKFHPLSSPSEMIAVANESISLSAAPQLKTQIIAYLRQASAAQNEFAAAKSKFQKIDKESPVMLDNVSVDDWRDSRRKEVQSKWEVRVSQMRPTLDALSSKIVAPSSFVLSSEDALVKAFIQMTKAKQLEQVARATEKISLEIIQVLPDGVLVDILRGYSAPDRMASRGGAQYPSRGYSSYERSGRNVFLKGMPGDHAEGDRHDVSCLRNGTYTYTDVLGASRTIPSYEFISLVGQ